MMFCIITIKPINAISVWNKQVVVKDFCLKNTLLQISQILASKIFLFVRTALITSSSHSKNIIYSNLNPFNANKEDAIAKGLITVGQTSSLKIITKVKQNNTFLSIYSKLAIYNYSKY